MYPLLLLLLWIFDVNGQGSVGGNSIKWQRMFWERNLVEPAVLRVPLIVILFLLLWSLNVYILDKLRIQYLPVIKGSGM
jgi:hypothetical protein